MAEKKYVYSFKEAHEANLGKELLGGKGKGLVLSLIHISEPTRPY